MRHDALIPLSHDHHEALLVALRLKKGGPSSHRDTLWPTDLWEQAEALLRFADRELYRHFEIEEELIFPLANTPQLEQLATSLRDQHREIRSKLAEIAQKREDPDLARVLRAFGELLEAHIRREERELFPTLETEIGAGRLALDDGAIAERRKAYRP